MNAAVLVDGHAQGGAAGARAALENSWGHVSEAARFSPLRSRPPRCDSRPLDAGLFAYLCRHGSIVSRGFAL
jgi:hypothetical protein